MEKLLTAEQVADFLGIHIKTFHEKINNNEIALPYVQVTERRKGFRPEAVKAFVNSRTVLLDGNGRRRKSAVPIKSVSAKFLPDGDERLEFFSNHEARAVFAKMGCKVRQA